MTRLHPAADRGTYIGLTRGCHEIDRDADRACANAPVKVAVENALEAPGNRAGRVNHAGPGESPGAILRDRRIVFLLCCALVWAVGSAGCWSKRASQPNPLNGPLHLIPANR
ncbi:hypothetical protein [Methylobacterium aquaticum]|uniref:Uncharacterized protein n=1 Tax=Methylobacterium aquaticum TaxID=270351 RepID=A0A0C6F9K3_9HYPH|nr:hypothetical protein [Methylobacterium aquaticum]BAQ49476.1 hypothetical protein Maq22A_1p36340 [Methylobacterium aquaticum]